MKEILEQALAQHIEMHNGHIVTDFECFAAPNGAVDIWCDEYIAAGGDAYCSYSVTFIGTTPPVWASRTKGDTIRAIGYRSISLPVRKALQQIAIYAVYAKEDEKSAEA